MNLINMRTYLLKVAICLTPFFFSACGNSQKTETQSTGEHATAVETETPSTVNVPITTRLAELGLTPDSDWRGIKLGDAFSNIKATEKGEYFESDAEHIGYTIELKNLETADILYYQTATKVSAIDVDLFLNSRQSVAEYQKELVPYFTARYGTPKTSNGSTIWTAAKGINASLKDVSKGKDYGLKIKMGPTATM